MKKFQFLIIAFLIVSLKVFAQQKVERNKINITGKIIEKGNKLPLEYATITFKNTTNSNQEIVVREVVLTDAQRQSLSVKGDVYIPGVTQK